MNHPAPPSPAGPETDARVRRVELLISNILRGGVLLSLGLILLGTAVSFIRHPEYLSQPTDLERLTKPGAVFPYALGEVVGSLGRGPGRAIVVIGLLTLIGTPVMRVAVSVLAFVYQRDYRFVAITLTVLVLLVLSFFLGAGG